MKSKKGKKKFTNYRSKYSEVYEILIGNFGYDFTF